jgi:Ca2+-binding EF-hand superfamily protein
MNAKEFDKFHLEKKKFMEQDVHELVSLRADLRDKNTEIAYLETQLQQNSQTISKLRNDLKEANSSNDETYQMIDQIWGRYDKDNSGELDKLETLNFLKEFLSLKGKPSCTIDQFNVFFKKYDINGDGMIEKSEMANFVRRWIQGQAAVGQSTAGEQGAGGGISDAPMDKQVIELRKKNEQLQYRISILDKTIKEGPSTVEDLEHLAYKVFNEDLRGRLKFVANFFDWHAFGDKLTGST